MTPSATDHHEQTFDMDDPQSIHDFIQEADVVEGPQELYEMVAELWPELLSKVKPPREMMH
jgi:hypothetical protein